MGKRSFGVALFGLLLAVIPGEILANADYAETTNGIA